MQVVQKQQDGLKHSFEVKIPAQVIALNVEKKLQEIAGQVNMPGFRPGKAPMTLLKQKYGPSVMGEVVDFTVRDSYNQALSDKKLRAAMAPKVEIKEFGENKDLVFNFDVEVLPEIALGDLSKIKLERIECLASDADVAEAIQKLSERHRGFADAPSGHVAADGDRVTLDFLGKVDGIAFAGGEAKGHQLTLGSGTFLPDFEKGVVGFKVGDSRDIPVAFPEQYHAPELAGKTAQFTITVHKIEAAAAAKADDELAKRLGFATLEDLQAAAKTQIGREYDQVARERNKKMLFDVLAETYAFDLPPGLVEQEFEAIWKQFQDAKAKGQVAEEDKDKSDDEMRDELTAIAERRVQLGLLLAEMGQHYKIDVSDDELRRAIMAQAQNYPGQEQKVIEYYSHNAQALMSLRGPLLEDKVIDFIYESANVTVKSMTKEDLFKVDDSAPKTAKKSAKVKKAAKTDGDEAASPQAAEEAPKPKKPKAKKE
jgi:trigger factor